MLYPQNKNRMLYKETMQLEEKNCVKYEVKLWLLKLKISIERLVNKVKDMPKIIEINTKI